MLLKYRLSKFPVISKHKQFLRFAFIFKEENKMKEATFFKKYIYKRVAEYSMLLPDRHTAFLHKYIL